MTSGGRTSDREIRHASGHPANPMSTAQRTAKQHLAMAPVLGQDRATAVIEAVRALDSHEPLSTLGDLVRT